MGGSLLLYLYLGRTGYLRNTAYRWSHMVNNVASALFGFIYIALWQTVAPERSATDPYTKAMMTKIMVMAQVFAWMTTFFPRGLGIDQSVRTGAIALEMARPVPYFPQVIMREAGSLAYRAIYRCVPLALMFAVTVGFPRPASPAQLALAVPSLLLGSYVGLTIVYTVGITSLWTTEVRWAHWLYNSALVILSGTWVPVDLLPGIMGKVAPYLPFAVQGYYPVRTYLGLSGAGGLLVQATWAVAMTLWCLWLTRRAFTRIVVQGG